MKAIELDIFFHTEATAQYKDMGMNYSMGQAETKKMTFYHINAISPHVDDETGEEYCAIHTNDSEYICKDCYSLVKKKLALLLRVYP